MPKVSPDVEQRVIEAVLGELDDSEQEQDDTEVSPGDPYWSERLRYTQEIIDDKLSNRNRF